MELRKTEKEEKKSDYRPSPLNNTLATTRGSTETIEYNSLPLNSHGRLYAEQVR